MTSRISPPSRLRSLSAPALASAAALAALLAAPAAEAQTPPANCPPGSWFCADAQEKPAAPPTAGAAVAPPAAPGKLEPLPPAAPPPLPEPAAAPPVVVVRPAGPPPVVVYQPPPPVMVRPPPPPYYYRPTRPRSTLPRNEWGVNVHYDGAIQGSGSSSTQPMMGIGFAMRYKPVPVFGLEAGFDFLGGHDYDDNHRNETSFTVNTLFFVNPRSHVQLYFLAGLGGSWASVDKNSGYGYPYQAHYTYFGGQIGTGLEFRLSRHFALNADIRGFIRDRTDQDAQYHPEFTNSNGQTTNTSGGALVTLGGTIYF